MKKTILLFAISVLTLTSCGGVSSSDGTTTNTSTDTTTTPIVTTTTTEETTIEKNKLTSEMIAKLAHGYKLETTVTQKINDTTNYFGAKTETLGEKITFKSFGQVNAKESVSFDDSKLKIFETYISSEQGELLSTRHDVSNMVKTYRISHPTGSGFYKFVEDGYDNFFKNVTANLFTKTENDTYLLKFGNELQLLSSSIGTQLYGNPGILADSIELSIAEGRVSNLKVITKEFKGSTSKYNYIFESKVVAEGPDITIDEKVKLFESKEDAKFEEMLSKLKGYNYTLTHKETKDGAETNSSKLIVDGDKIQTTIPDPEDSTKSITYGYYKEDGVIKSTKLLGSDFIKTGTVESDFYYSITPEFNINNTCFDLENGVYTMKKDIEGDIGNITPFETNISELQNFKIEQVNQNYVLTNTIVTKTGTIKLEVTVDNIAHSEVSFIPANIKEPTASASWDKLLSPADFASLTAIMSKELLEKLPVPTGLTLPETWINFSEEAGTAILCYNSEDSSINEVFVNDYLEVLETAGYKPTGKTGELGNIYTINEKFSIEVALSEGLFAILVYLN